MMPWASWTRRPKRTTFKHSSKASLSFPSSRRSLLRQRTKYAICRHPKRYGMAKSMPIASGTWRSVNARTSSSFRSTTSFSASTFRAVSTSNVSPTPRRLSSSSGKETSSAPKSIAAKPFAVSGTARR
jgi:hypothetical protein